MRFRSAAQNDEAFVTKLIKHLSAYTAGRCFTVLGTDDRNRNEMPCSLRDRLGDRATLRTKRGRIRGIFNITAGIDLVVGAQKSRTHIEF